jgi:hypothetical protein
VVIDGVLENAKQFRAEFFRAIEGKRNRGVDLLPQLGRKPRVIDVSFVWNKYFELMPPGPSVEIYGWKKQGPAFHGRRKQRFDIDDRSIYEMAAEPERKMIIFW